MSEWKHRLQCCQDDLVQQVEQYNQLRDFFVSLHQTLSPQSLSAAFGNNPDHIQAFLGAGGLEEGHNAMTERLLANRMISREDVVVMLDRIRNLIQQTQSVSLDAEKIGAVAKVTFFSPGMRHLPSSTALMKSWHCLTLMAQADIEAILVQHERNLAERETDFRMAKEVII